MTVKNLAPVILLLMLSTLAFASPNEASGVVTGVVDGDTIEVDGIGRVHLADIDCPEMSNAQGPKAKQFTIQWLQNNFVTLDIDEKCRTCFFSRIVAVVYLVKPDGSAENFNRKLVDEGLACIRDFTNNEFDPADWWNGTIPATASVKSDSSGKHRQRCKRAILR